jgi:2-oxoglutarate ferredoxin oxidoreductase subunit gamma
MVIVDSTIVKQRVERRDVSVQYVPATELAEEKGLKGMANIILLGRLYRETAFCSPEALQNAVDKCVPEKKANLREKNRRALQMGMEPD